MFSETFSRAFRISGFRPFSALIAFIGLCGLALPASSAEANAGEVQGRVFNISTGIALRNARVIVEGSTQEAFTDEVGAYRLYGVPAGEVRLSVSYVGLESQTTTVTVIDGKAVQRDFDLFVPGTESVLQLDTFTVSAGERSAQSLAVNERQNAPNISNVVAFEEFGDRGDENIGEYLRFLPGVAVEDGGQIASSISLRGFPSVYTTIMLDGAPIAGARGSRSQSVLDVPMGNMSRTEVSKTPTPDMPASGLGGSINLVTKNGLSTKKPVFNYQVYYITDGYTGLTVDGGPRGLSDELSPKYQQPSFNFNALIPVAKTFAISFGGSRTWRLKPMERDGNLDTQSDWNITRGYQRVSSFFSLDNILKTWSAHGGFDWKPTANDSLTFAVSHRYVSNNIMRNTMAFNYGTGATGDGTYSQSSTANGSVTQGGGNNQETGTDTTHTTLKYSHVVRDWRLDIHGSFSRSESFLDDIDNGHFNATTITTSTSTTASSAILKLRGEGIGENDANIPVRYSATNAAGTPVNLFDGSAYNLQAATSNQNHIVAQKIGSHVDFTRDFNGNVPFTLKTGVFIDRLNRDQKGGASTWSFNPNGLTTAAARNVNNFDFYDEEYLKTAPTIFGQPMRWVSLTKVYDLYKQRPDWFVLNEAALFTNRVNSSRKLIETVSAAYIRGDLKLMDKRLLLVGGVRFEHTNEEGHGPLTDPTAAYQKNPDGSLVDGNPATSVIERVYLPEAATDLLKRAQLTGTERGSHSDISYQDFYPSLNITYKLTNKLYLRAAYSETIGRPDFGDIIPGVAINDTAGTINVTNAALKPLTARNYDFSIESYQIKGGFGSIGIFHKDISDFGGNVSTLATPELLELYGLPADPTYLSYYIKSTQNSGDAKMTGYEFTYTQSLLFLPDWARGIQVYVNGTKLELSGSNTADFTGFAREKYAGGINFVRPSYSVKLNFTYQGETRGDVVTENSANGIPANTYNYQGARLRIGVNFQYSISKRYVLFGSMTDIQRPGLLAQTKRYADDTPDHLRNVRRQELGSTIILGVKGVF